MTKSEKMTKLDLQGQAELLGTVQLNLMKKVQEALPQVQFVNPSGTEHFENWVKYLSEEADTNEEELL